MLGYATRRILQAIPTLLLIVAAAFFLMRAAPGGPFDEERALPPEIEANLQAAYGLDQPVTVQFARYLGGLVRGAPPLIAEGSSLPPPGVADPLPQALVLTAIVISFGMTAFVITLALRAQGELDSDQVDGRADTPEEER